MKCIMYKAHENGKKKKKPAHLIFVIFIFLLPLPLLKENHFIFGSGMFLKRKGQRGNTLCETKWTAADREFQTIQTGQKCRATQRDTKTQHLKEQQEESFKRKTQTFAFSWRERLRLEKQEVNILVSPFLVETTWGHSYKALGDKH